MPHPELVKSIQEGNLHQKLPETSWHNNLAAKYEDAKKLTGFVSTDEIEFEPAKHLQFYNHELSKHKYNNTRRLTMEELGLTHKDQISPIGVSDPFPLFTEEAINIMRQEVLNKDLFLKYARYSYNSTSGMDCVLRGYAKDGDQMDAPFTYKAWTHPKTVELISKMAGEELQPIMDYEIAHVNISMKDPNLALEERIAHSKERAMSGQSNGDDIPAVVGWHYDSYPFVCVLMLSDTTNMIGGETSLRMGAKDSAQVAIVPGPQSGYASVLQGRLIEHIAPSPLGVSERITMVTSYRSKDPLKKDRSVLSTVKPEVNHGSIYNSFYYQWIEYRAQVMKDRLDNLVKSCRDDEGNFQKFDAMDKLSDIEAYLKDTREEMGVSPEEWAKVRHGSLSL